MIVRQLDHAEAVERWAQRAGELRLGEPEFEAEFDALDQRLAERLGSEERWRGFTFSLGLAP